ncbi:hypothetical protein C8R43DRAFT_706029 [Mycena crocata]|nr:hypothetical protein C8R43DRAFT_706029 [Mycena crocata]
MSFSMIRVFLLANVALLASAAVIPRVPGNQFITGPCATDSDCAQGCCAFTTGKCAGPVIALTRDGGCGFGSGKPNANAAKALGQFPGAVAAFEATQGGAAPAPQNNAGAAPAAPKGTQFITGPCGSDAECEQGCCGFNTGKCAGPVVALTRDGGCGFGSGKPNANAAKALGQFPGAVAAFEATQGGAAPAPQNNAASAPAAPKGTQFVTGPCGSDAECEQGCCGFNTGKCAGPVVALTRDGGCGFGSGKPNANAAKALGQFPGAVAAFEATQ